MRQGRKPSAPFAFLGGEAAGEGVLELSPSETVAVSDAFRATRAARGPSPMVAAFGAFERSGRGDDRDAAIVSTLAVLGHECMLGVQEVVEEARSAGTGCSLPAFVVVLVIDVLGQASAGTPGAAAVARLESLYARARDVSVASA